MAKTEALRLSCPHRQIRDAGATKWVIPSAWALQLGCMSAVGVGFGERPNNSVSSPVARSNSSRPSGDSSRACSIAWGLLGGEDAFDAAIRSLCQANIPRLHAPQPGLPPRPQSTVARTQGTEANTKIFTGSQPQHDVAFLFLPTAPPFSARSTFASSHWPVLTSREARPHCFLAPNGLSPEHAIVP